MSAVAYAPYELSDEGVLWRLHRNEAPLAVPDHVVRALRALTPDQIRWYPAEAQERLARTLAARLGTRPERLVLANGADELLCALARSLAVPGDEIVFADPSFGMYERAALLARAHAIAVPYERRWQLDVDAIAARCSTRTKLIVLGNPNNPTGESLALDDVIALARAFPEAAVAVDEVYLALSDRSLLRALEGVPNAVVIGSFSKSAGLAALRVGYAVAPKTLAATLRAQITPFPLSAPSIAGALAYLDDAAASAAYAVALRAQTIRSLDAVESAFAPYASNVWRGCAPFALFELRDAQEIARRLAARGIALRRFEHAALRTCLRVSAAGERETDALLCALPEIMREVRGA